MPDYEMPVQIAMEPIEKKRKAPKEEISYTKDEQSEKELVDAILSAREEYAKARLMKEKEWSESYKMYMSYVDTTRNPYLSNLFIPKTHEAVEMLAAFLIGTNQSITAEPENNGDSYKASAAGKYLDFLWRKELRARLKILTWVKQGIVFGNGAMKCGWDADSKRTFIVNTAIEDVYFDFYEASIQDSEYIIHEIRLDPDTVKASGSYNDLRKSVVTGGQNPFGDVTTKFANYDKSLTQPHCENKVVICEAWCKKDNRLVSIAPTAEGWRVIRNEKNPYGYNDGKGGKIQFRPFVKLRFKTSPLPNRAYDTGAVYPTVKIQKSFNDLVNQYFDNVVIINNAMWIKRRGARINPAELVRRPGGVITVSDITNDLKSDVTADIKQSLIEMLNRLDAEFQQASMVVNLLKGVDSGTNNTATEVSLGQQNIQTLLEMLDENIADALSELGDMVLAISLDNADGNLTVKMFENDNEIGLLEFDPKNISGRYDIKIRADRSSGTSKVIRQKQLLDLINLASGNQMVMLKYPKLVEKAIKRWLEEGGYSDSDEFFEEVAPSPMGIPGMPGVGSPALPGINAGLTPGAQPTVAMPKA